MSDQAAAMPVFLDRNGRIINRDDYLRGVCDPNYHRLARTQIAPDITIESRWVGACWPQERPLRPFMVTATTWAGKRLKYLATAWAPTWADALAVHREWEGRKWA